MSIEASVLQIGTSPKYELDGHYDLSRKIQYLSISSLKKVLEL
jgi:hypothetical protein